MQHHSLVQFSTRIRTLLLGVAGLFLGLLVGCDVVDLDKGNSVPAEPIPLHSADSTVVGPGLYIELRTPDTVALGDPFRVQARTENPADSPVSVVTGSTCLYRVGLYDGAEQLPVEGSLRNCATVQTDMHLRSGTQAHDYEMRAVRAAGEDAPVQPGGYTARLTLNWRIDGAAVKDTLNAEIAFVED